MIGNYLCVWFRLLVGEKFAKWSMFHTWSIWDDNLPGRFRTDFMHSVRKNHGAFVTLV